MKKIKQRPKATPVAKKEFRAEQYFHSQRLKIVRIIGFSVVIILCSALVWMWFRNREINGTLALSQAKTAGDYEKVAARYSFTRTKPLAMTAGARELFNQGKYTEAISVYKEFIKQYPSHRLVPSVLIALAYCYEETGDYKEAETVLLRVKKDFPGTVWAKEAELGHKRIAITG